MGGVDVARGAALAVSPEGATRGPNPKNSLLPNVISEDAETVLGNLKARQVRDRDDDQRP